MATFTKRCSQNNDNAIDRAVVASFSTNPVGAVGQGLLSGESGAGVNYWWNSAFRFSNITIPKGSIITSAIVTFTHRTSGADTSYNPTIYLEKVASSADFGSDPSFLSRTTTTATVTSFNTPASRTADATFDTPDLSTLVQEVIGQGTWQSGNAMMVILKTTTGTADTSSGDIYFYTNSSTKCPLLTITYTPLTETLSVTDSSTLTRNVFMSTSDTLTMSDSDTEKYGWSNTSKNSSNWINQSKS